MPDRATRVGFARKKPPDGVARTHRREGATNAVRSYRHSQARATMSPLRAMTRN